MSTHQRQLGPLEDAEIVPGWIHAWVAGFEQLDAETLAHVRDPLRVTVENAAGGGVVPDALDGYDAPVVELGTGTHLHAPDLTSDPHERACSRGRQNGAAGNLTEYDTLFGWGDECADAACAAYFDGLRAAGLIGEGSDEVDRGGQR